MILSKLDSLSSRDKILIVIAISMLIAVLVDHFVVQKIVSSVSNTQILINSDLKSLAYNDKVIACSGGVEECFQEVVGKLGRVTSADSDIDIMKGEIDDLARQSGLLLTSMKNRDPKKDVHYTEYIVDISSFEGTEESLLKFLDAVQLSKIPGLMRVIHLSIGVGRKPNTIKGSMTITKVMIMREGDV
jgi:Tfp pilus assembly protein PilO